MNTVIILLLGVTAMVAADSVELYSAPSRSVESASYESESESYESESYESSEAKYDFNWAVKDDSSYNDFGQQEGRDGDNTQGSYYVHLPDGRLQKVTYYVDGDEGYIADVKYEGEAHYDSVSHESGSYESASFESASFESASFESYGSNESK
ncbi:hypothetical protein Pmani_031384 [Petrolisthes manimaculis]|uniref:Pro-resilin n=1 Tax=Petrolisthes manimaculis TaxID=1843537 RepID=A0AAE1TS14_9EUCA|nr:hypothetical protein Pmani_031384 [Petrolisthes manimaculis]